MLVKILRRFSYSNKNSSTLYFTLKKKNILKLGRGRGRQIEPYIVLSFGPNINVSLYIEIFYFSQAFKKSVYKFDECFSPIVRIKPLTVLYLIKPFVYHVNDTCS